MDRWRFIGSLLEGPHHYSFEEVAKLVGDDEKRIREAYRNLKIVHQAEDWELPVAYVKEERFGVLTRALQGPGFVTYLGIPGPWEVAVGGQPVPEERRDQLLQVIDWLTTKENEPAVIKDSRQLSEVSKILLSPQAAKVLAETRSVERASQERGAPLEALLRHLSRARAALQAALPYSSEHHQQAEVEALLRECEAALASLRSNA